VEEQWTDEVEIQGGNKLEPYVVFEFGDVVRAFGGDMSERSYTRPELFRIGTIGTRREPRRRGCQARTSVVARHPALSLRQFVILSLQTLYGADWPSMSILSASLLS
jgi:hypothetical protein